jgi:hypothetical protein
MHDQIHIHPGRFPELGFQRGDMLGSERTRRLDLRTHNEPITGSVKPNLGEFAVGIGLECLNQLCARLDFNSVSAHRLNHV